MVANGNHVPEGVTSSHAHLMQVGEVYSFTDLSDIRRIDKKFQNLEVYINFEEYAKKPDRIS